MTKPANNSDNWNFESNGKVLSLIFNLLIFFVIVSSWIIIVLFHLVPSNFNEEPSLWSSEFFRDRSHLNQNGSISNSILPDLPSIWGRGNEVCLICWRNLVSLLTEIFEFAIFSILGA